MNGVQVRIRCEAIKGQLTIVQCDDSEDTYEVSATNYIPYQITGNSLGEVIDRAMANIHQMRRTQEFKARKAAAAILAQKTREQNGTTNNRGPGNKKPASRRIPQGKANGDNHNGIQTLAHEPEKQTA